MAHATLPTLTADEPPLNESRRKVDYMWARKASKRTIAFFAATAMLALTACGGADDVNQGGSGELDRSSTLRISNLVAPSLDPAEATTGAINLMVTWPVIDRLLQVNEEGVIEPMLATEWSFSDDGKALNLKLREDVTFSDGAPFNAEAVTASLEYYMEGEGSGVVNALEDVAGVRAISEYEVAVDLTRPTDSILPVLAQPAGGGIMSPASIQNGDPRNEPIGTGAWTVESFASGENVTFTRRPDDQIWDPNTGKAERIEIQWLASDAMYNALRSGQIDIATAIGGIDPVRTELDQGRLAYREVPTTMSSQLVYLNQDNQALSDVQVRQAMNYAVDREAIAGAFGVGTTPRVQPLPAGLPGHDPELEDTYSYDPDEARRLLAAAGYANGVDIGEILVANSGDIPNIAQAVQEQLSRVGINAELRLVEIANIPAEYGQGDAAGMITYSGLPMASTQLFLNYNLLQPGRMPSGISDEVKTLITGIDDPLLPTEERALKATEASKYLTENAYFVPLLQGSPYILHTPNVVGWDPGDLPFIAVGIADYREVGLSE